MKPNIFHARMRQFAPVAPALIGVVVAAIAYLQALNYPFVSDDTRYITENTKLAGLHVADLWRLFFEPYNILEFLPLRDFSYWLDITLFGLIPSAFRVHNIFLYLLCCLLVYDVTLKLWQYFHPADAQSAPWVAAAVTVLFAVHPAHVEAVVWISGRKDVLSGMFSMLALWLAVSAKNKQGLSHSYAAAALFALLAAMLSKATTVVVAPVIALLWVILWRDIPATERRRSQLLWPLASLLLAACVTLFFVAKSTIREPAYYGVEAITRALAVPGWMARLAVSPENRHFFYPVFEDTWLPVMVALGITVLLAAVGGVVVLLRRRSLEGFALVAFVLFCMPYTQLIPYQTYSLVTDRFLFLAVWPAMLMVAALSWRFKPALRTALLLAIALTFVFQTTVRPRDWRSQEALIDADLRAYPGHYFTSIQKILLIQWPQGLYREASETASKITDPEVRSIMTRLDQAYRAVYFNSKSIGERRKAMALLWDLAVMLNKQPVQAKWNPPMNEAWGAGQGTLAYLWEYQARNFPDDAEVRYNAGLWMLGNQRYEDAAYHLRAATESQHLPEFVRGIAFKKLGLALMSSGHFTEAEIALHAALEQAPPDTQAYCFLSALYKQAKRTDDAARAEANCPRAAPGLKK